MLAQTFHSKFYTVTGNSTKPNKPILEDSSQTVAERVVARFVDLLADPHNQGSIKLELIWGLFRNHWKHSNIHQGPKGLSVFARILRPKSAEWGAEMESLKLGHEVFSQQKRDLGNDSYLLQWGIVWCALAPIGSPMGLGGDSLGGRAPPALGPWIISFIQVS